MSRLSDLSYQQMLLLGLVSTTVLSVGVVSTVSSASFGAYNPAWDGTSTLRQQAVPEGADRVIVTNTSRYNEVDSVSSIAFVISPDRPYTPDEAQRVREFVRSGGTLVIAEDFGPHTNPLLADLGVGTRVDGRPLRDEARYYRSPDLVVATDVSQHTLTAGVQRLTLNHGTALRPDGARVLVNSSAFAYLDADRDGSPDDDERLTEYPVAAVETVGQGRVVIVSDPSLFINSMIDRPDNRQFVETLLSDYDTVLLDYSHTGGVPPLISVVTAVRTSVELRAIVGTLGIVTVGLARWYHDRSGDGRM